MRNRIVIAVLAVGMFAASVGNQARAIDPNRVPPAPTGHRQPTARDVPTAPAPPQKSADEEAQKKWDQDLERKMKSICKGC